jgi:copper chaperone CopZ
MADKTITSANSTFTLVIPGLFPVPVQLKGYAADKSFMLDANDIAEAVMGVDGIMSAGYTPQPTKMTVTLQADSDSKELFNTLIQATKARREVYFMSGVVTVTATGETFALTRGVLTNYKQLPDHAKTLQPQDFVITWQSIDRGVI